MSDHSQYPRTCRFCGGRAWHYDLLKYGTRAYAHYACFVKNKTIEDMDRLPAHPRGRLQYWLDNHDHEGFQG